MYFFCVCFNVCFVLLLCVFNVVFWLLLCVCVSFFIPSFYTTMRYTSYGFTNLTYIPAITRIDRMQISLQLRPDVTHQMRALRVTLSSPRTQCSAPPSRPTGDYFASSTPQAVCDRVLCGCCSNGACHDIMTFYHGMAQASR